MLAGTVCAPCAAVCHSPLIREGRDPTAHRHSTRDPASPGTHTSPCTKHESPGHTSGATPPPLTGSPATPRSALTPGESASGSGAQRAVGRPCAHTRTQDENLRRGGIGYSARPSGPAAGRPTLSDALLTPPIGMSAFCCSVAGAGRFSLVRRGTLTHHLYIWYTRPSGRCVRSFSYGRTPPRPTEACPRAGPRQGSSPSARASGHQHCLLRLHLLRLLHLLHLLRLRLLRLLLLLLPHAQRAGPQLA